MFQRRDVEIADQDRPRHLVVLGADGVHLGHEIQLVPELAVDVRIGFVATGGNVEVVKEKPSGAGGEPHRDVPAVVDIAEAAAVDDLDGAPRDGGDAVVTLLAADLDVAIAELMEGGEREQVVRALRFLQAEDVGRMLAQQTLDQRQAQANGVDVPGGDGERHRKGPGVSAA